MGCYYCNNGSTFRVNQNCPRCGRQGKLAADHVQVFREEIAAHGDPQLATVKALDAWLFGAKAVRT